MIEQINNLLDNAIRETQHYANLDTKFLCGIESGFSALDKVTHGWQNGDLILISGRPSMGKTAFILSMMINMSVKNGISVGIINIESTEIQFASKIMSNYCEIENEKLRCGMLAPYEWEQLDYRLKKIIDTSIYSECSAKIKMDEVSQKAREMVKNHQIKVLYIDYVQLISVNDGYSENRYGEINYISRELKALAKELNIPIIAVSQMNRNLETDKSRIEKRPMLTDLRDSGTLCDDADVVCLIYRPEYYHITEDSQGNSMVGLAEIIIAKQRNGATGSATLKFRSKYSKFMNIDEDIEGEYNDFDSPTLDPDIEAPSFLRGPF